MTSPAQNVAAKRLQETIDYLWSCYDKDRDNLEIRNRLAEHYTPLAQQLARRCARRYGLHDADAAVSDALLLLLTQVIPHYDGSREFRSWAVYCIRRKLWERARLDAKRRRCFKANYCDEDEWPEVEALAHSLARRASKNRIA